MDKLWYTKINKLNIKGEINMIKTMRDIRENVGRKIKVHLDSDTFEATIVEGEFTDCEGNKHESIWTDYAIRYDYNHNSCTWWGDLSETSLKADGFWNLQLEPLGDKLDRHNIPYNIGKRVAFKSFGEIDYGELVKGSFYDCAGEYREFEDDTISIKFDKRTSRGTTICSEVDKILGIAKTLGFELELTDKEEEPEFKYGDVVLIKSCIIKGLMKGEDISLPYGMYLQTKEMCGDTVLEIEGLDKKHGDTWKIYGDGVEKLNPIEKPQQGDRIIVKCYNDELVHGLYVPEGANYYDANFDIKQAEHKLCVTSGGREVLLNNMEKVYKIEEVL